VAPVAVALDVDVKATFWFVSGFSGSTVKEATGVGGSAIALLIVPTPRGNTARATHMNKGNLNKGNGLTEPGCFRQGTCRRI
jgi:hypothetical protein